MCDVARHDVEVVEGVDVGLIAGLVEHYLDEAGAPAPSWLGSIAPLAEPWHIDPYTSRHPEEIDQVPAHLRRRNVILDRSELESV